jgi:hypothetical protein
MGGEEPVKKLPTLIPIAGLAAAAALLVTGALRGQSFTYVGAQKCALCHKADARGAQYKIWQASRHSKSYELLASAKAAEAAQSMGVDKPAEDPRCLKCHAPLYDKAPELEAEGVTCEVCHGPGSAYRKLPVMQDRVKAVANGLLAHDSPEAVKSLCLRCHEDAHGIKFDFEAAWAKIKHPVPGKS